MVEALDKQAERPFLAAIKFALTVATALDRRSPACQKYRFSHCLPTIGANAANSDIRRVVYRRFEVVITFVGRPFHVGGTVGSSFGAADRLRLSRRVARR